MSALKRALLSALLLAVPAVATAQVPPGWDTAQFEMSREDLENLLSRYESVIESPGYSRELKDEARKAVDRIRSRLEEGDFRTGDRIVVQVEGEEDVVPDTLLVTRGPAVEIPDMGRISLAGVLRSELEEHLTEELGRFVRDPTVTVRSLIRVSVQGAVGRPGFYVFPADMLLGDVIMGAGGPAPSADLDQVTIRRGQEMLMNESEVRTALDEGRSLDQLGLRAGDEITVPEEANRNIWPTVLRVGGVIASTLLLGVRIF